MEASGVPWTLKVLLVGIEETIPQFQHRQLITKKTYFNLIV